jgi:hypothetical protein
VTTTRMPPHGTRAGYLARAHCGCFACRLANAEYMQEWKERHGPQDAAEHGTRSTYCNYGCRCAPCRAAAMAYARAYRARRQAMAS